MYPSLANACKDSYTRIFSRASLLHSVGSIVAATLSPFVFAYNRYFPSVFCIILYGVYAVVAFRIVDYSEGKSSLKEESTQNSASGKVGKGLLLLLAVFSGFICTAQIFSSNSELFMSQSLKEMVSEQNTVYIYRVIVWLSRAIRIGVNVFQSRILNRLKERILVISTFSIFSAFALIGVTGILFKGTWIPIAVAAFFYIAIKGIFWAPARTFLLMTSADSNSKRQQQTTLVAVEAAQSIVKLLMDLIVVAILKLFPLVSVFIGFAAISAIVVALAILLKRALGSNLELLRHEAALNAEAIDAISNSLFNHLLRVGMDQREALSYRLLAEEKLLAFLRDGKEGKPVRIVLAKKLDAFFVDLTVGEEKLDVFEIPTNGDELSREIFFRIVRNI